MKDELLKDDSGGVDITTYFGFHFANKGKYFVDLKGGKHSKLDVFIEYRKDHKFLKNVTAGKIKSLLPVDKPNWKDGVWQGEV